MQNRKKNLWLVALVGALTIAFAGGCPDDDDKKTPGTPSTPTTPSTPAKETYYEWHSLDKTAAGFGDDKLTAMVVSGGNFYFGTTDEGLVIWDGQDEKAGNFTKLKAAALNSTVPVAGTAAALGTGATVVRNLVEIGSKKVAFIVDGSDGIGIVSDKAMQNAWVKTQGNVSNHAINTLAVVEGPANAKFLFAAMRNDGANNILFQPLAGLVQNWNNALADSGANALDKQGHSFGVDKDGNLMIGMANTAGVQGIKQVAKANVGGGTNQLTSLVAAHGYTSGFADAGEWANNKAALHLATFGNRLVVATDDKLLTIDDITVAPAAARAKKLEDTAVYGFVKDGADGLFVFTKANGILYVKKDGSLDADKAMNKKALKTKIDVEAGKTSDFGGFTDNIIASATVGKKTYYATGDKGVVVREEKERNKQ